MSQRVQYQWQAEAINAAMHWYPEWIQDLIRGRWIDFFCGNSFFSGLQPWDDIGDGRNYSSTSHVIYETVYPIDRTTIVLASNHNKDQHEHNFSEIAIIHEIAHVMHEDYEFEEEVFPCVSEYAEQDDRECWAEALTAFRPRIGSA